MDVTIEDVKEFIGANIGDIRDFMKLLVEYSDTPEVMETIAAIPALASKFKPIMEGLREFSTELDIKAVKQLEAAGLTTEQAVSLVVRHPGPVTIISGAITGAQKGYQRAKR